MISIKHSCAHYQHRLGNRRTEATTYTQSHSREIRQNATCIGIIWTVKRLSTSTSITLIYLHSNLEWQSEVEERNVGKQKTTTTTTITQIVEKTLKPLKRTGEKKLSSEMATQLGFLPLFFHVITLSLFLLLLHALFIVRLARCTHSCLGVCVCVCT